MKRRNWTAGEVAALAITVLAGLLGITVVLLVMSRLILELTDPSYDAPSLGDAGRDVLIAAVGAVVSIAAAMGGAQILQRGGVPAAPLVGVQPAHPDEFGSEGPATNRSGIRPLQWVADTPSDDDTGEDAL